MRKSCDKFDLVFDLAIEQDNNTYDKIGDFFSYRKRNDAGCFFLFAKQDGTYIANETQNKFYELTTGDKLNNEKMQKVYKDNLVAKPIQLIFTKEMMGQEQKRSMDIVEKQLGYSIRLENKTTAEAISGSSRESVIFFQEISVYPESAKQFKKVNFTILSKKDDSYIVNFYETNSICNDLASFTKDESKHIIKIPIGFWPQDADEEKPSENKNDNTKKNDINVNTKDNEAEKFKQKKKQSSKYSSIQNGIVGIVTALTIVYGIYKLSNKKSTAAAPLKK